MMAMVSELSMHQANALKLQQEVKSKEQALEQGYIRMERGEPPNEEAEREWLRMVREQNRKEKEQLEKTQVRILFVCFTTGGNYMRAWIILRAT